MIGMLFHHRPTPTPFQPRHNRPTAITVPIAPLILPVAGVRPAAAAAAAAAATTAAFPTADYASSTSGREPLRRPAQRVKEVPLLLLYKLSRFLLRVPHFLSLLETKHKKGDIFVDFALKESSDYTTWFFL